MKKFEINNIKNIDNIYIKMDYFISNEGYNINKKILTQEQLKGIINELTVTPFILEYLRKEGEENTSYELYKNRDDKIIVPIYYGKDKFGETENKMNIIRTEFKFKGELREYQIPIVEKCLTYIKNKGGGLLSIPCGGGKTLIALYIASQLQLKTLIVVHKTFLMNQWIERIKQFTTAKVGIICRDIIDIENKDIVIGMIQSICKRDYDKKIFEQFSFVIYDEAHHSASKIFSKALMKTPALHTLALSATPYRGDQMIKIMHWFLGGTIYRIKFKINKYVIVKCIHYYSYDYLFKERMRYIKGQNYPDTVNMISNLCKLQNRIETIVNIINTIIKDPERKILVLSERKSLLNKLKEGVDQNKKIETKTYYYIGDMNEQERKEAEMKADIIFATYQMAKEGLDIERLNTVILATSQKDVIQSVGRIMRKILQNGDTKPLIIDLSDDTSIFINHSKIRKSYYTKCEYTIENYYICDNKCMSHEDYKNKIKEKEYIANNISNYDEILYTKKILIEDLIGINDVIYENSDNEKDDKKEEEKKKGIDKKRRIIPIE